MRRKYISSQGDINTRRNKVDFSMYSVYFVSKLLIENKQRNLSLMVYYTSSSLLLGPQVVRNFSSLVPPHSFEVQMLQSRWRGTFSFVYVNFFRCRISISQKSLSSFSPRVTSECPYVSYISFRRERRSQ